jgi:uncharacterized protein (TIGR00730 family)
MTPMLKSLCVFCGSRPGNSSAYTQAARTLGRALAERGTRLVYGGGSTGLMGEVANAVLAAGGEAHGVMPAPMATKEVVHGGLTKLHLVETMHERKALMEQLSEGFIALPGGYGTFEELFEIITWSQLGIHRKPIGLLDVEGYFAPLRAMVEHGAACGFIAIDSGSKLHVGTDAGELLAAMSAWTPTDTGRRWITRAQT